VIITPYQFRVYILFLSPPLGEAGKGSFVGAFYVGEFFLDIPRDKWCWAENSAEPKFDLWSSLLSLGNRNKLRLLSLTRSLRPGSNLGWFNGRNFPLVMLMFFLFIFLLVV